MIDHFVQPLHTGGQRFFAVLVKKELGIGQTRTHDTLVTANHGAGIRRADIADDQELVAQLSGCVQQGKVLLIGLHGENQALLWHVQEFFFKFANQHIRALNQTSDFIQQGVVVNRFNTPAYLGSRCRQLAHDFCTAFGKAGDDSTVFLQRCSVAVCMTKNHRVDHGFETVAMRGVAGLQSQRFNGHHTAAV